MILLIALLLVCVPAFSADVSGDWAVSVVAQGERVAFGRVKMTQDGEKVTFRFVGADFTGTVKGDTFEASGKAPDNPWIPLLKGRVSGARIEADGNLPNGFPMKWTAERIIAKTAEPKTHEFTPTVFQRYFSAATAPVLTIRPGDTVRTWSVDAGGRDKNDKALSLGGNPLTGPFYVEGVYPGDTLVVRLLKVRTNRDWAGSGRNVLTNTLQPGYIRESKDDRQFQSRWTLDAAAGKATLSKPTEALKNLSIPIKPMLGCVAVAPPGQDVISTRDSGQFGGNMDYNQIQEGTTVYLPVFHAGALLLVGDGHAAQGDGELTGDALETSMDIEFQVDVLPGKSVGMPYAENAEYLMMIGIAGSLDEALRRSTTGMARWLEQTYKLNSNEAAMLLGFALKYDIADLVGTQVSVVAKMPRSALDQLKK